MYTVILFAGHSGACVLFQTCENSTGDFRTVAFPDAQSGSSLLYRNPSLAPGRMSFGISILSLISNLCSLMFDTSNTGAKYC